MTQPRIYLSGPMTGIADFNFPAFNAAAKAWRALGWAVENPAESFDGDTSLPYTQYVAFDISVLRNCAAIALLPGWDGDGARGSVWERYVAEMVFKLPVLDASKPVSPEQVMVPDHDIAKSISTLPTDSAERKSVPLARGVLDYFPAALAEVARLSEAGNAKHNPGEDLHWARGKSMDHADCILRHLTERGTIDTDGLLHDVKVAWRALAMLQEALEVRGAPMPRGARQA